MHPSQHLETYLNQLLSKVGLADTGDGAFTLGQSFEDSVATWRLLFDNVYDPTMMELARQVHVCVHVCKDPLAVPGHGRTVLLLRLCVDVQVSVQVIERGSGLVRVWRCVPAVEFSLGGLQSSWC